MRVRKLQEKIFLYSKKGNRSKVHQYQKLLVESKSGKLLAVRKVTQDNRGKNTAGVDGVKSVPPGSRLALSRAKDLKLNGKTDNILRVYIPKSGTNERRPLGIGIGIPTMRDRAKQALAKLALEPEWEALFEQNSYGFRPGRNCPRRIAVEAILISQSREGKFVLDADIRKCFDRIDHAALIKKLNTWPQLERQIYSWLKAGILDGEILSSPVALGVISPLLCNIALHGMEKHLSQWVSELKLKDSKGRPLSRRDKVASLTIVRYADDLVVLHKQKWIVESAREKLSLWLGELGLELKPEKTRIGHTTNPVEGKVGFDFLGFNVRKYSVKVHHRGKLHLPEKTFIKPSTSYIKEHADSIRRELRKCTSAEIVVAKLTPVIREW
ncbi:MAG: hypothetical protein F6K56_45375, partial [Moorea sp. SIO3G5]|nr:hypothetical protein [Moorena sp. SIO3G5]